jgi:hypothetical protein
VRRTIGASRIKPGTMAALIAAYRAYVLPTQALGPSTRRT